MDSWRNLIETFVSGKIDAPTFELAFLDLHRSEVNRGESIRYAVDLLFYEVDAYCADPRLRRTEDLDDEGLLVAARKALDDWELPWPPIPVR